MKKLFGSVLGGLFAVAISSIYMRDSLAKIYGINTDNAFTANVGIPEYIGFFITTFLAAFFGVFVACYMSKEKFNRVGVVVIVSELIIVLLLILGLVFMVITSSNPIAMDNLKNNKELNDAIIMAGLGVITYCITFILGGYTGVFIINKYFQNSHNDPSIFRVTDTDSLEDYLNFYFPLRGRSFFTIVLFFAAIGLLITNFNIFLLYLKWFTIGTIFIILHPSAWGLYLFKSTGIGLFSPLVLFVIPVLYLHAVYKIGKSPYNKALRVVFLLALYFAVYFVNNIAYSVSKAPIEENIHISSSRGIEIWPILLDMYSAPMATEDRYNYYVGKMDFEKTKELKEKAISEYYELAKKSLEARNKYSAKKSIEKIIKLSGGEEAVLFDMGLLYVSYEIYDEALDIFKKLNEKYPGNEEYSEYLDICYQEIGKEEE